MSDENSSQYGYESDDVKQSPFKFGLNAGNTFLKKFEWIANGGKDGAEQEALDIVFTINGTDKNFRLFPITKAFLKDNKGETTDQNAPEFKTAVKGFNAIIAHIAHAFIDDESYQSGLNKPIKSFKEFCQIVQGMLPTDFSSRPLDIFLQYQWQISESQNRTYLDVPKKMAYGKWLCAAKLGTWKEVKKENPADDDAEALYYLNENDEKHPFVKNGWFMNSNFAIQQKDKKASTNGSSIATGVVTPPASIEGTGSKGTW